MENIHINDFKRVVYANAANIIIMKIQNKSVNIVIQVVYHVMDLSLIIALDAEMKQIQ
jgi:hypothetical protein